MLSRSHREEILSSIASLTAAPDQVVRQKRNWAHHLNHQWRLLWGDTADWSGSSPHLLLSPKPLHQNMSAFKSLWSWQTWVRYSLGWIVSCRMPIQTSSSTRGVASTPAPKLPLLHGRSYWLAWGKRAGSADSDSAVATGNHAWDSIINSSKKLFHRHFTQTPS